MQTDNFFASLPNTMVMTAVNPTPDDHPRDQLYREGPNNTSTNDKYKNQFASCNAASACCGCGKWTPEQYRQYTFFAPVIHLCGICCAACVIKGAISGVKNAI
jgi:hypothetical protein